MPPKANNNREAVVVCARHVVKQPSKRSVLVHIKSIRILKIYTITNPYGFANTNRFIDLSGWFRNFLYSKFTFKFRLYSPYRSYGICNCMDFGNPYGFENNFQIHYKPVIHPDPLLVDPLTR